MGLQTRTRLLLYRYIDFPNLWVDDNQETFLSQDEKWEKDRVSEANIGIRSADITFDALASDVLPIRVHDVDKWDIKNVKKWRKALNSVGLLT
jgi:hypothetical protein